MREAGREEGDVPQLFSQRLFSARGQMAASPQLHTLPTLSLSGRTLPSGLGQSGHAASFTCNRVLSPRISWAKS